MRGLARTRLAAKPYDEAGWVLDGTDQEIEHSVASLRGARGRDRAWQTVGDFFRMWVMALGGRQGWLGGGDLPARPFVDWPWLGFAASLADAYAAADRSLTHLDSLVLDRGLGPLLESARLRLPG